MAVRFRSHLRPGGPRRALPRRLAGGHTLLRPFLRTGGRRTASLSALAVLLFAALVATAGARGPLWTPPPVHVQPSYLALGDSLAFGYSQAKFDELFPEENPADFETGYVNDFGGVLKLFDPNLQIVNDGCPGETTESFIKGPCAYQLEFPLHHPYAAGPDSSQLADALAYLQAHPGSVNPITIDIGANDALGLIEGTCKLEAACIAAGAPAVFAKIAGNLALILGDLRAAAPRAQIIVLGLYNPFGETIAGGDALTADLNEAEAGVAASVGARFADPLPVFNPPGALEAPTICLLTNMCTPLRDIHPTELGYRVLGGLILRQYVLGLREWRPAHSHHSRGGTIGHFDMGHYLP
jgi:lysophospholipase L1-like esterase